MANLTDHAFKILLLANTASTFQIDDKQLHRKLIPLNYDPDGDILILEAFLNNEPPTPIPNQGDCSPETQEEIKLCEAKTVKSSIDEPPEVELKDLPPHLEYAFLEDDNKLPVIIAKELSLGEKADLIKVLKSHKRAIAWKLSDIQGINPEFCTHKILMEEDYKPTVQHQRRLTTCKNGYEAKARPTNESRVVENSKISLRQICALYELSKVIAELISAMTNLQRSKTKIPLEWTIHHHSSLFLYGTVDYLKPNGPNFKVNGHRVKAHFEGSYQDWIADKCISYKRRENQAKIVTTGHEWKSGCEDEAHQVKSNPEKKEAKKR
ncbi:hypothetical protein Tco_0190589 [Tanacetum coccineum]